jgi:hypothetical protein
MLPTNIHQASSMSGSPQTAKENSTLVNVDSDIRGDHVLDLDTLRRGFLPFVTNIIYAVSHGA